MKRREFVRLCAVGCTAAASGGALRSEALAETAGPLVRARHWTTTADGRVECRLCPRRCAVADGERGYCGVRRNTAGTLFTLVHSRPCSVRSDPIEKKPLFHYRPGTDAFSIATAGCNFACQFCQNWRISQYRPEEVESEVLPPAGVVAAARAARARSIAFTYSEPVVFQEYAYDTSIAARAAGIGRVVISNGFIERRPMEELLGVLDGVKIDLKSFRDSFYADLCDGSLRPVLDTLRLVHASGVWLEIVVLIVPTHNDSDAEIRAMARWIVQELGPNVPLHLTRFHPTYQLTSLPRTPVATIERLRLVALDAGVRYVYLGNVAGHEGENTACHACGRVLIERDGWLVRQNRIRDGRCPDCGAAIPGLWT
jgi:pyruvate formate lyase activating enzyme